VSGSLDTGTGIKVAVSVRVPDAPFKRPVPNPI